MKRFFPFFLECAKRETDQYKKKELENLAFGNAVIIAKENKDVMIIENEDFIIPECFSVTSYMELEQKLWENSQNSKEYYLMEKSIKEILKSWTEIKKRDKIRKIDNFIIRNIDSDKQKNFKSFLVIFLLLKLIKNPDIKFENFDIKDIKLFNLSNET